MGDAGARGKIGERPWGLELAAIDARGDTGQLAIDSAGKRYCVAFERGAVVGATSPLASDSAARIALATQHAAKIDLTEIAQRTLAAPDRDDVEIVAEAARLSIDEAEALRRRVIAQRAARTFCLEHGTFAWGDRIRVPHVPNLTVDVRAVVYLGARTSLPDERLAGDLRALGTHFTLRPDAADELARFGFTERERPVLHALRDGASLAELAATHRELDERIVQAIVYALATCDAVTCVTVARTPTPAKVSFKARAQTAPEVPTLPPLRAPTPRPRVIRTPVAVPVKRAGSEPPPASPAIARTGSGTAVARVATGRIPTSNVAVSRAGTPNMARTSSGTLRRVTPAGQPPLDPIESRALAEQAFARGEKALRAEQLGDAIEELAAACELAPSDVDYAAHLAWARFCQASDKVLVADATRKALDKAIYKSPKPATALFFLGRVERILGRDQEALRHFQEVLALQPTNDGAATEVRVLEARIAASARR